MAGNFASLGGAIHGSGAGIEVLMNGCTLAHNEARLGSGIYLEGCSLTWTIENTIIAFGRDGVAIRCEDQNVTAIMSCSDVFGNERGDWVGCIAGQQGVDGNISEDPLFCDAPNGDFTLRIDSPCAPAHSGGCGLIGVLPVGCGPTAVKSTTWGAIKALHYNAR